MVAAPKPLKWRHGRTRLYGCLVPRLLGSEKVLDEKREKRAEARAKKNAEARKAMEDAEKQAQHDGGIEPIKEEAEDKKE